MRTEISCVAVDCDEGIVDARAVICVTTLSMDFVFPDPETPLQDQQDDQIIDVAGGSNTLQGQLDLLLFV